MPPVSVIIPLAPGETSWRDLVGQLNIVGDSEIILAAGDQDVDVSSLEMPPGSPALRINKGGRGRAGQMNSGASTARHEWLWFLHADSKLTDAAMPALERIMAENAQALYFFDLKFLPDGPRAMIWNEWAVRFRAGWCKIPFGDQGFLIRKDLFETLGGYREDLNYGEDHVLVWKVRQEGFPVLRAGAPIFTSARRYQTHGWAITTAKFVYLTLLQAVPQGVILLRRKFGRMIS